MYVMSLLWQYTRDVNETVTFETETRSFETKTETTTLETETKILQTGLETVGLETVGLETETGLKTTMIVKLLCDRDIHTGCS